MGKSVVKYVVKDFYDDWFKGDTIGKFDTLKEAQKYARYYDEYETDGECSLEIWEYKDSECTGKGFTY